MCRGHVNVVFVVIGYTLDEGEFVQVNCISARLLNAGSL